MGEPLENLSEKEQQRLPLKASGSFPTTQWSLVAAAASFDEEQAQEALTELCRRYWFPLYAFARRKGKKPEDAEDYTQSLFKRFLEKGSFQRADVAKGRLRTFLMVAMERHLRSEHLREKARKRGGADKVMVPIDSVGAERLLAHDFQSIDCPERIFDRGWALSIIQNGMARLEEEYEARGRGRTFRLLRPYLIDQVEPGEDYALLAAELRMSRPAVRVRVFRLRKRFQGLL
ncbi:MAG: sigma-70 family RNA polymerase sigma factor, partial [Verrucomicrobiota bacterium]